MGRRGTTKKRRWAVSIVLIVAVIAFVVLVRLVEDIGPEKWPGERFVVARIIDGDTMELRGGDRLRLLALDTPEKNEPFYNEASDLLARVAADHPARIEFADKRRDRYGRLLGYLYVDDTLFVNRVLIDSGLGYVYLFKDNELTSPYVREMIAAQRSAIERKVGLWGLPREPESAYINKPGSFRLHRPGCRSVRKGNPADYVSYRTREEGLATGLSPCRICKP